MNTLKLLTILLTSIFLLTACEDKTNSSASSTTSSISSATIDVVTDTWLGKWNGPEGTFLEISGSKGIYTITIADLDGPKQYQGTSKDNQIIFHRNGVTETLQTSNGADTGMKWLADKSNCLRTRLGEGWCRD